MISTHPALERPVGSPNVIEPHGVSAGPGTIHEVGETSTSGQAREHRLFAVQEIEFVARDPTSPGACAGTDCRDRSGPGLERGRTGQGRSSTPPRPTESYRWERDLEFEPSGCQPQCPGSGSVAKSMVLRRGREFMDPRNRSGPKQCLHRLHLEVKDPARGVVVDGQSALAIPGDTRDPVVLDS